MNADTVTAPAPPTGSTTDASSHLPVAEPVSIAGLTAEQAVARLRELRAESEGPIVIEAPLYDGSPESPRFAGGLATDYAEVGGNAYAGWVVDGAWFFQPTSLQMACLHTGWAVAGSVGWGWPERPVDPNEPTIRYSDATAEEFGRAWREYRATPEYKAFAEGPRAAYWAAFMRWLNSPWGEGVLRWVLTPTEAVA